MKGNSMRFFLSLVLLALPLAAVEPAPTLSATATTLISEIQVGDIARLYTRLETAIASEPQAKKPLAEVLAARIRAAVDIHEHLGDIPLLTTFNQPALIPPLFERQFHPGCCCLNALMDVVAVIGTKAEIAPLRLIAAKLEEDDKLRLNGIIADIESKDQKGKTP